MVIDINYQEGDVMKNILASLVIGLLLVGCGGGGSSSAVDENPQVCQNYTAVVTSPVLWQQLSPNGTAPSARSTQICVYDTANDRLIIHGGKNGSTTFGHTWVVTNASSDGGTPSWQQITTATTPLPTERHTSIAGYNTSKNMLVEFGGVDQSNAINMELWTLSNANGIENTTPTWSKMTINGTPPSNRTQMSGVYDETKDMLVFFGGVNCTSTKCTHYDNTWMIQNVTTAPTWQKLATSGATPSARTFHATTYDGITDQLIIFAGSPSTATPYQSSASVDDTWILSNVLGSSPTWSQVGQSDKPDARAKFSAVLDSKNKRFIAFGGVDTSNYVRNDTWILTDTDTSEPLWAEYNTGTAKPSNRMEQCAVYTGSDKNKMIVFGGQTAGGVYLNDIWVLNNANGIASTAISNIVIKYASTTICRGYTAQLVAVATDASGNEISGVLYMWSSSDTSVVTVSPSGELTAVGVGTATITVISGTASTQLPITISAPATTTTDQTSDGNVYQYWKGSMVNSYNRFNFNGEPALTVSGKPWMVLKYDNVNNKVVDCQFGLSEVTQTANTQYDGVAPEVTLNASSIEGYEKLGIKSPVNLMVSWNSEYTSTSNKTIVNKVQEFSFESHYVSLYGVGFAEAWNFTYTSDIMVGDVTNIDDTIYFGATSASKEFNMVRLPL